ncbi:MAG: PD-(D/E)XK nuclease family protein [Treponema sp.]|nr:PD-(D/E)XK nuclease family protein [Candidatus Treponema equifaecale]
MSVKVNYCAVEERDMDTLFLEAIGSDENFLKLFTDKIEELKACSSIEILSIELSKTDNDGESDITVVLQADDRKLALLIEDKINAPAMENQCERYTIRGNKGKKDKVYDDFFVFIVAPQKYYAGNDEAKKYEHFVSYEEFKNYLETKDDVLSEIWKQQFEQAIEKGKRQSNVTYRPKCVEFLRNYIAYQKENYPDKIEIATTLDNSKAGGWIRMRVNLDNAFIYHKMERGYMDLNISGAKDRANLCKAMLDNIRKMGFEKLLCVETGNSMSYRYEVPIINNSEDFSKINKDDLNYSFEKAEKLVELADILKAFSEITSGK